MQWVLSTKSSYSGAFLHCSLLKNVDDIKPTCWSWLGKHTNTNHCRSEAVQQDYPCILEKKINVQQLGSELPNILERWQTFGLTSSWNWHFLVVLVNSEGMNLWASEGNWVSVRKQRILFHVSIKVHSSPLARTSPVNLRTSSEINRDNRGRWKWQLEQRQCSRSHSRDNKFVLAGGWWQVIRGCAFPVLPEPLVHLLVL